jgi:aryl-phospho-beta-D-glucosidase BglC (GH1 family)
MLTPIACGESNTPEITASPANPETTCPVITETKPYIGEIADITMQEFLSQIGPGYNTTHMAISDPSKGYDPFDAFPTKLAFAIGSDQQHGFWSQGLILNEKLEITFDLSELPEQDTSYTWFAFSIAVTTYVVADVHVKIENARVELPDGDLITFDAMNGEFSGETDYLLMLEYCAADLDLGGHLIDLPDTETLRQGVFKAEDMLLQSNTPDMERLKTLYYSRQLASGLPELTQEWFAYLKSEGFNSIRFQVTWFNHTNDETYEIDRAWLERVEEIITMALDEGLYVMINVNLDMFPTFAWWFPELNYDELKVFVKENPHYNKPGWLTLYGDPKVEERYAALWKQIAEYFKDYNEYVVFEAMNEPGNRFVNEDGLYTVGLYEQDEATINKYMNNLNRLNQIFVDSVRGTGGNNAKRLLLSPTYYQPNDLEFMFSRFALPNDPANRVAASFSFYNEYYDGFSNIKKFLIDKGIPVVFPEFGAFFGELEERAEFLRDAIPQAKALNIPVMYWDYGEPEYEYPQWWAINFGGAEGTFELFPPEIMDIVMGRE